MKNKYFNFNVNPWDNTAYGVELTTEVTKIISATKPDWGNACFSYQFLIISLFGLRPRDFFDYIRYEYHAKVVKTNGGKWKLFYFTNINDANKFANECNRRFTYCVNEGFFQNE